MTIEITIVAFNGLKAF